MTLYRKFRPDTFTAIKGQEVITGILKAAIGQDKLSHAYLFTGTRGTGKTTTARVLARAVNCTNLKNGEPCNLCDTCKSFLSNSNVDLIEIDAASNRGIDDIRELREKIQFSPVMSKYKVYIIDEVHMLSKDAFNALLKTLEEPPSFVIFILATTEIYKLPLTIISRCQRFDFKNAPINEIVSLLQEIAKKEKVNISDDIAMLVADLAEGSFRDALSIFEKLVSVDAKLTYKKALAILGIPDSQMILSLFDAMKKGKEKEAIEIFRKGIESGLDIYQCNKQILKLLERALITNDAHSYINVNDALRYCKEFLHVEEQLRFAAVPSLVLESAIFVLCEHREVATPKTQVKKLVEQEKEAKVVESIFDPNEGKDEGEESVKNFDVSVDLEKVKSNWSSIVRKLTQFNHHLGSFLSKAKPIDVEENILHIEVKYSFHKDRIEDIKLRDAVAVILEGILGHKLYIQCRVNPKLIPEKLEQFEKKVQIEDNTVTNTEASEEVDILKEAMKIFEVE